MYETWASYVEKSIPGKETSLWDHLLIRDSEAALSTIFEAGQEVNSSVNIAKTVQGNLFQRWMRRGESIDDDCKLDKSGAEAFVSPKIVLKLTTSSSPSQSKSSIFLKLKGEVISRREVGAARLLWHRERSRQLRDKAPFEQFRATRGKSAALTRTVTLRSLDEAWTGFVLRWNKEGETPASACCRIVRLPTFCCPSVRTQLKAASCRVIKVTEAVLFTMKKDAYAVAGTTSHDQMTVNGIASWC
ncbi:hypothetical protein F441_01386 [Phytophthora nicotianae CJ01A1]|uniref:Uncharacterized protein n=2 Tax=Phytophthora nicotianae TaxID=4792 RepID=W2XV21_PHYNI|nr:hypothetical protein F444_01405 [Phytophthora nicotianae P1976]ETP25769.1 hypothetical protein F441_01386 [Phytophthora nicotianae CJ01A1]